MKEPKSQADWMILVMSFFSPCLNMPKARSLKEWVALQHIARPLPFWCRSDCVLQRANMVSFSDGRT